jgi:hypothetical protein
LRAWASRRDRPSGARPVRGETINISVW